MSPSTTTPTPGVATRRLALDVLGRIEGEGAYANLALGPALERAGMDERDRGLVTELVYGTTRMRRACEFLVRRHRDGGVSDRVAAALRLGAYQLAFAGIAPHAAVDATVAASPKPARGLVNAVLRRIAADVVDGPDAVDWPDLATRLSYPGWIVGALTETLGDAAPGALAAMNSPATVHVREDGYVQDLASQHVVAAVGAEPGELVLDLCAAPGGKATGLASTDARVVAADIGPGRVALIAENSTATGRPLAPLAADGVRAPFADDRFDRTLVDAPCSGLGVLRRRPDARWRIEADDVDRLADLQVALLGEAARVTRPGGTVVYSVCTLTAAESDGVLDRLASEPRLHLIGRDTLVPDDDRDGMFLATFRVSTADGAVGNAHR